MKYLRLITVVLAITANMGIQAAEELRVDSTLNRVTDMFAECAALNEFLLPTIPAATKADIEGNAKMYRYIAIVSAAALFPNEDVEYANTIASARINLRLLDWSGRANSGKGEEVNREINPLVQKCVGVLPRFYGHFKEAS